MKSVKHIVFTGLAFILAVNAFAVSPSPDVIKSWKEQGILEKQLEKLRVSRSQGMCDPSEHSIYKKTPGTNLSAATSVDTVNVLVILVDFSDHVFSSTSNGQSITGKVENFDSLLFSRKGIDIKYNPTGSMTEYYLENSYNKFFIQGKTYGWVRAPQPYSYYVGDDNGMTNSRLLARHAVEKANQTLGALDFSNFDNDKDGQVDGLIIVHAGPGREVLADTTILAIWSHKWVMDQPVTIDGVTMSDYVMCPEETIDGKGARISPIGVFCHEFGHMFGLPDLYDTDALDEYRSAGLGVWSLMASGNYNGFSEKPAHFDPWSKIKIGFVSPIVLDINISQAAIPAVEYNPVVYLLKNPAVSTTEYWLVENRMKKGFDAAIPLGGLLIYHIDEMALNNNNPNRYKVALEQADGFNELGQLLIENGNYGNNGDVWPGTSDNRNFNEETIPHSKTNLGAKAQIGVWNISNADSIMYADLDVKYSRPWIELDRVNPYRVESRYRGKVDNTIKPGDTVSLFIRATNLMRTTYNAAVSMHSDFSKIEFIQDIGLLASEFGGDQYFENTTEPIIFVMPDSIHPMIDTFYITIIADSLSNNNAVQYQALFSIPVQIGKPNILLVDDDNGAAHDTVYANALTRLSHPHDIWHTDISGSPSAEKLAEYSIVFWHTGDRTSEGITHADMIAIKNYLEAGGSLFLSSNTAADSLKKLDQFFMSKYFKCTPSNDSLKYPIFVGSTIGSDWEGLKFFVKSGIYFTYINLLTPLSPGEEALLLNTTTTTGEKAICGVSFSGSFKTFFTSLPIEYIDSKNSQGMSVDSLFTRVIDYFGLGIITDVEEDIIIDIPKSFHLSQNYPNPFNPVTTISFTILNTANVKREKTNLTVFNMLGQEVITLVDDYLNAGNYTIEWDGTNQSGEKTASGVYLYRLVHEKMSDTKKMILLK